MASTDSDSISKNMDVLQNLLRQLQEIWAKLSVSQQVLFGVAALGILGAGGAMTWMGSGTEWRLLYGRLDAAEAGRIITVLEGQKVPHRIVSGGSAIQVPAEQVHSLRAQLAAKGMPKADGTARSRANSPGQSSRSRAWRVRGS